VKCCVQSKTFGAVLRGRSPFAITLRSGAVRRITRPDSYEASLTAARMAEGLRSLHSALYRRLYGTLVNSSRVIAAADPDSF
jgi:hypothetical protein